MGLFLFIKKKKTAVRGGDVDAPWGMNQFGFGRLIIN
jgi:hypothetical protein